MVDLWYINAKKIDQEELRSGLRSLPPQMINEICRFMNQEDCRLKLFGRLMVKKYFEDKNIEFSWSEWCVALNGKPYYKAGKKFNISHSRDYVAIAFSDQEIGADIEVVTDIDVKSICNYFHPDEVKHIVSSLDPDDAFFSLWTRKEAYLT